MDGLEVVTHTPECRCSFCRKYVTSDSPAFALMKATLARAEADARRLFYEWAFTPETYYTHRPDEDDRFDAPVFRAMRNAWDSADLGE